MPFPKTHKTKTGTDLGGGRVRARREGKKKSRDLLKHMKFDTVGRRQGGDAETVGGRVLQSGFQGSGVGMWQ